MRRVAAVLVTGAVVWLALASIALGAPRPFTPRFTTNDTGDVTGTGNTLLTCPDTDANCAGARPGRRPAAR